MKIAQLNCLLLLALVTACDGKIDNTPVIESIKSQPILFQLEAWGVLKSNKSVPLSVPGSQWAQRQLAWTIADGSVVKKGDLVARFIAPASELERDQARIDLLRNALLKQAKEMELTQSVGRVDVDMVQVQTDITIADTYAQVEAGAMSRNQILDAVQDREYLGEKKSVLQWQRGQSGSRSAAEIAVISSQLSSATKRFETSDKDLAALEVRAPNDGVLILEADWNGDKPQLGGNMYAGNEFARIPDPSELEIELTIPVQEALQAKVGQRVWFYPSGRSEEKYASTLSFISSTPQQQGRQNPVKVLKLKTSVPKDLLIAKTWAPGQAFRVHIELAKYDQAISVPNLAIISKTSGDYVLVKQGTKFLEQKVSLGERGPARSVIKQGLKDGTQICVLAKLGCAI